MFKALLPKEEKYFDDFREMISHIQQMAKYTEQLFAAELMDNNHYLNIKPLELRCDEITSRIVKRLNKTFITPFDREDIYSLAHEFDSVIDIIHAMNNRLRLYNLNNTINEDLIRFAELIEQSVDCLANAVRGLRNLKQTAHISNCCIEVNTIENHGDQLRDAVFSKLFLNGSDPLHIIKWKDIFMDAETVLDKCEDVANIVAAILIKQG